MFVIKKIYVPLAFMTFLCTAVRLYAGDTAIFVDLGFSPVGDTYMFGQYGVHLDTLKPWADLYTVDVCKNDFVHGGRDSYTYSRGIIAGQNGSGALYWLLSKNAAFARSRGIDYLEKGRLLFVSTDISPGKATHAEFHDYSKNVDYKAQLIASVTEKNGLESSFYIDLVRTDPHTSMVNEWTVGNPEIKRPHVAAYSIYKVLSDPESKSLIFVVAMKVRNGADYNIRFMVEAVQF